MEEMGQYAVGRHKVHFSTQTGTFICKGRSHNVVVHLKRLVLSSYTLVLKMLIPEMMTLETQLSNNIFTLTQFFFAWLC